MTATSKSSTHKQAEVLAYLTRYIDQYGFSPTVREIADAVGFKSSSTAFVYLARLQKAGKITSIDGRPRTMRVVS
jgi:repressor LexA